MKALILLLAVLMLIGGAFAGGYFLRPAQATGLTAVVASKEAKPAAPPKWTEWQYPKSDEQGSSKRGGGSINGVSVGPDCSMITTTPDTFDQVMKWYAKKFNSDIMAVPTGSGSFGGTNTENKDDPIISGNVLLASDRPRDDPDKSSRPVSMKVISVRTPRYFLVINVSRAEAESHTYIIITYFPNTSGT